jgi:hypothetical protein
MIELILAGAGVLFLGTLAALIINKIMKGKQWR